jgi:divalent metal cation (Fe/Co/Zn/Cd) transporter
MTEIILSIVFLMCASACNAVMDTLSHHYYVSIFSRLNPKFWDPAVSWEFAKKIKYTKYKVDAWHLFKSLMIIFICLSVLVMARSQAPITHHIIGWIIDLVVYGCVWNLVFNYFYNHILIR